MDNYKDIVKILFLPEYEYLVPDGCAYSEAICEVDESYHIVDSFFLYSVDYNRSLGYGPTAKIVVSLEEKKVISYIEIEDAVLFSLKYDIESSIVSKAIETYEELYPRLREIMLKNKIDQNDRKMITQIYEAFFTFTNEALRSVYKRMSPKTFDFIERTVNRL